MPSWLKWAVAVAAAIGAVFGILYLREKNIDESGRSRLVTAHQIALPDGRPALLLVESVRHPGGESADTYEGRLDVVDAKTGARLARAVRVDAGDCLPADRGRIWCDERTSEPRQRSLVLRDLATLKVVASDEQLRRAVPALEKGIEGTRQQLFVDAGVMMVGVNDGTTWAIDPAKCPACEAHETEITDRRPRFGFGQGPSATLAGEGDLGFAGRGKQSMVRRVNGNQDTPIGTSTFLDPSFLGDGDTTDSHGKVMMLEGRVRLVVHADTLDRSNAKVSLSAVDETGASRWTTELGKGRVLRAWHLADPDLVIVAMQADESWVLAIDAKTGQIRWRFDA